MAGNSGADDDDYMGDLSLFLPPDPFPSSNKRPGAKVPPPEPPKRKRPKAANWQEQRRLDLERKQREEDQMTQAGLDVAIPASNIGFKMLRQMGYSPGTALGKDGAGRAEPVGVEIRRSRAGIGALSPLEVAEMRERAAEERMRRREERMSRREEVLVEEFGSRQKMQWRSRRVVADFRKAEAVLAQLENREVVEAENEDGDEAKDEEEEEEITEEDLHDMLMKLRDQYNYCLYCGCQYESAEALLINCPGSSEDDH